jgi:hypothetical protein
VLKNAVSQFGVKARFLARRQGRRYKVKGKPKGTLRVVGVQKRCKRGERKVVWNAAGQGGQSGSAGQNGSSGSGQQGRAGSNGTSSPNEVALKTEIASLNVKVDGLEKVLEGITHGDLTGVLSTLNGVTNPELQNAIGSVPLLEEVCGQTEELTGRSNSLLGLLDTLDALNVLSLPLALPTFNVCPAP